jgi:hypothetical protein
LKTRRTLNRLGDLGDNGPVTSVWPSGSLRSDPRC